MIADDMRLDFDDYDQLLFEICDYFFSYSNLFLFFCNTSILDYREINFGLLLK